MSKTLTVELPDEIYDVIQDVAASTGRPVDVVALEWLLATVRKPRPPLTEAERNAAWERLRRHAGAVDIGDPRSSDNERIDADLAREYGNTHEEG